MLRAALDVHIPAGAFYLWPQVADDEAFARGLFEQQHVQLKLNEMHMLTEALRSFVLRVAAEGAAKTGNAAKMVTGCNTLLNSSTSTR